MEENQTLPILSLAQLSLGDPKAIQELSSACQNIGFFYLKDHGIPQETLSLILGLATSFFLNASPEEKDSLARRSPSARGYQKMGENITKGNKDAHEAIDLYRPWDAPVTEDNDGILTGDNLWPETPPSLRIEVEAYIQEVLGVGGKVVQAMARSLDLQHDGEEWNEFVGQVDESFWVARLIGYPPLESGVAEGISCGEHTDYGCVTLLLTDSTKGALEVQAKSGAWMKADPIEGAFVINIGDMIERWTNGHWKSTLHRVIHKGSQYRVSAPVFFEPNFNALVKPLKSCVVRTGGKPLFDSVVYGDHLKSKIRGNFY